MGVDKLAGAERVNVEAIFIINLKWCFGNLGMM